MASAATQHFGNMADHAAYSTRVVEVARTFCPTTDEAARIDAAAHRFVALQSALHTHIWHHEQKRLEREHGWFVMPRWIDRAISRTWDDHAAELMALAEEAMAAALARECVA